MNAPNPDVMDSEVVDLPEDAVQDLAEQARDVQEWVALTRDTVAEQVRQRPYAAVAVAVGAGYVLGGGLPTWVVRMAVGTAVRTAVTALLLPAMMAAAAEEEQS